jgi:glutamyl-tRNA synthetase
MKKVRTRFAPSPTGYLHLGGLHTVLFAYLLAKSQGGQILFRIEDTDSKREVEGAREKLIEILARLGFTFDEGPTEGGDFGPYIQSERQEIYQRYADEAVAKGIAYPCFCSAERLQAVREEQQAQKLPPRYDRCCRDLDPDIAKARIAAGESFVLRQKMPDEGELVVHDYLRGDITFKKNELEDQVLIKSNGIPTYQFAVVIDDHLMEISHVVRGDEWIPSFPKNILLYEAFGWEAPIFVHLPLLLNKGGGKLSKRQGDVSVEAFLEKGYLIDALINFSALLGWHPKDDKEILSLDEIIKIFRIEDVGTSPAVFDLDKLDYLNGYYIRQMEISALAELCKPFLAENIKISNNKNKASDTFIKAVVALEQERLKKLIDIGELTKFFFVDNLEYEKELLIWKGLSTDTISKNLNDSLKVLEELNEDAWTAETLNEIMMNYIKANEAKVGDYLWPMRVALTGEKASPSPFDVAAVLGKAESIKRIKLAIEKLK